MTLILATGNSQLTVVASDRRLSHGSVNRPPEDEFNKAAVLICDDARVAIAFTGLASVGKIPAGQRGPAPPEAFLTTQWILETLSRASRSDHQLRPLIDRFTIEATNRWKKLKVAQMDKWTEFVFAGYRADEEGASKPYVCSLTNRASDGRIEDCFHIENEEFGNVYGVVAGDLSVFPSSAMEPIRVAMNAGKNGDAVAEIMVHAIREAAKQSSSIGSQCNSVILPADPTIAARDRYHTTTPTTRVYGVNTVEARSGHAGYVTMGLEMGSLDQGGAPVIVSTPKVERNKPCPCGNGKSTSTATDAKHQPALSTGNPQSLARMVGR
jgi:hypothetical protein